MNRHLPFSRRPTPCITAIFEQPLPLNFTPTIHILSSRALYIYVYHMHFLDYKILKNKIEFFFFNFLTFFRKLQYYFFI